MIQDALNKNFGLPSMGDYYYDAPDMLMFYDELDKKVNPLHRENNGIVARDYYCEEPPALGHDEKNLAYTFGIKPVGGTPNGSSETVGNITVNDGDTITVPLSSIITGDDDSANYIKQTVTSAESDGVQNPRATIRFACMDSKELPHFIYAGPVSDYSKCKTKELTYDQAKQKGYVVSKYKSFMEDSKKIDKTYDDKEVNGNFYSYNKVSDKKTFVETNGAWRQYFDKDGSRYILAKADCNDYTEETMADAGIARDTLANALANAEELRFVVDETVLNRDMNATKTMFRTKPFDRSTRNSTSALLDFFFDKYTQFSTSGFTYYGLDSYGRMIGAVYGKFKNSDGSYEWVNLNKLVISNSNTTEVNKYGTVGGGSPLIDSASYKRLDDKAYADAIYDQSKQWDDRDEVQGEIFKSLGRTYDNTFKDWTVTIGDVTLFVPPTSIRCVSQSKSERMPLVRAKGTMAKSATKVQRLLEMTLYFNEDTGINGFEYNTKTGMNKDKKPVTYHMNGLRALYAQFRVAPFLPIENDYINIVLGIDAVYMINFSCNTVPGFPKLLQVTLQLSEFDYRIYMPEIPRDEDAEDKDGYRNYFAKQINYPLFRYYYQRLLMRGNELKNTDFMDDTYIKNTFGNKTALVPMKFQDPSIRFYVPNRAQLEQMLQTKKARLTAPATENFTNEEFAFAEDMAKVKDAMDAVEEGNEETSSPVENLNRYLKGLNGKTLVAKAEKLYVDGDDEATKQVQFLAKQISNAYQKELSGIKNVNGENLISGTSKTKVSSEKIKEDVAYQSSSEKEYICIEMSYPLNAKYINDTDINSIRTVVSPYSDSTVDEIFEDRKLKVVVRIPADSAKIDEDFEGFKVYKRGDYAALDYLANKVLPLKSNKGNDASNGVKARIDYVSPDSIKFDRYNEKDAFVVEAINISTSNSFSQITLQETSGFAPQYMGGTDVSMNVSLFTKSESAAASMNFLPSLAAEYAREYRLVLSAWPLRIESELTKFFGITEVMVESVEVDTVPNYPGLYHVMMSLVSVDRTLRNRESLTEADMKATKTLHNLTKEGLARERYWGYSEMNKYLSEAQLYPDLELPELDELEEAGFKFIRYSNKNRKYPDPDFYFTYSYILVSQIIRETVLQGLNAGEILMIDETTGEYINGKPGDAVGAWRSKIEVEEGWDVEDIPNFNEDDKMTARIINDFTNSMDKDRDEIWTIAPNVKVALCEKRMTNHINDAEKRRYQQEYGGDLQIDSAPAGIEEGSGDTNDQRYYEVSKDRFDKVKAQANKVIDDILSMTVEATMDAGLESLTRKLVKEFNTQGISDEDANSNVGEDVDKWLTAAADAICSSGNVTFSPSLKNKIGIDANAPWRYKKAYRARVDKNGYWEDIELGSSDLTYEERDLNEKMGVYADDWDLVRYNSIQFGFYDFRFYSEQELEDRFGAYGTTKGAFFGLSEDAVPRRGYGKIYLADPIYRFAEASVQEEYVVNCTKNFEYAKAAFFRICLLYLKVLISYDILPSFSYDVFREAVLNKERMEKVLNAVEGRRQEEEKKKQEEYAKQRQKATQSARYATESSEETDEGEEPKSEASEAQNGLVGTTSSEMVEKYQKEFRKNRDSIDNGKIFLTIAMGVVDGNREFLRVLNNRNHNALCAITTAAAKDSSLLGDTEASGKYLPQLNAFIRALAGEGIIDCSNIGAGDPTGPANVFMQVGSRRNVSAAAASPETYLIHSFYDMIVNDCRGRMLRAFPTFYMVLIDEGRKVGNFRLHDNFYNTSAISSITISKSRKIPTDTAEIVMANFYKTFTTDDEDLNMNYTTNFTDVFNSIWLPTLQSYAEKEEQRRTNALPVERIHLRPGARVHLRLGYGADASHLPISFNGMIAELETGDVVKLICQSDGAELAKPIMMDRQAYELPGVDQWVGASSIGENGATPKTIIDILMNCHDGKLNALIHDHGYDGIAEFFNVNTNPFGIYHFGSPDVTYAGEKETVQNVFEVGVRDSYTRYMMHSDASEKPDSGVDLEDAAKAIVGTGTVAGALGAAVLGTGVVATGGIALAAGAAAAVGTALFDDAGGIEGIKQWVEKTMDSYNPFSDSDVIPRINFDLFGKTVWDVVNICRSVDPEYMCDILPFHMRSTLFMGRPNDYYAYDYELYNGAWIERRKPYQQYHIYSSFTDIINNNIAVSTKDMKTCAVGLYTVSGFMNADVNKRTDPQWLDASIYPEYQRTMYVDTKLYGRPSRKLGVASDVLNWIIGGISNSTFDRSVDDDGDVRNHHAIAVKMTKSALKMAAKEMYQGRLTVIGDPSVKPNDRMCLTDVYNGITGQCLVRDVVHVFSADDGYKTVLTPDLITAQTGTDAENEFKRQSLANTAATFASGTLTYMVASFAIFKYAGALKRALEQGNLIGQIGAGAASATMKAAKALEAGQNALKEVKTMTGMIKAVNTMEDALSLLGKGGSLLWNGAKALRAFTGPMGMIATTLGLGTMSDVVLGYLKSRKCLVVFPLQKYGRPMVGGMDGHCGSVYGAPNFGAKDSVQEMFAWAGEKAHVPAEALAGLIRENIDAEWANKIADALDEPNAVQKETDKQTEGKTKSSEAVAQRTLERIDRSRIGGRFSAAYFNPLKPRYNLAAKSSDDYSEIIMKYAVKATSQEGIAHDANFRQGMYPVIRESRLKRYFDLGYFRVAAHEKGFTESLSSKIKCVYLPDPDSAERIPVNAIVRDDNTLDIPYLNKDALGVLCEIIRQSYAMMTGTENERDEDKWYEDNKGKFVTLTSGLICGALKREDGKGSYEATGFSFVLTSSDGAVTTAISNAVEHINKQMTDTHKKVERVPEAVMSAKVEGDEISIVVHPPKG